jgi:hypothetical protein
MIDADIRLRFADAAGDPTRQQLFGDLYVRLAAVRRLVNEIARRRLPGEIVTLLATRR